VTRAVIRHLTLTDFRSYERAELALDGRSVFLFGPNGAGKTNLLEAISLLSPGRGLRGASIAEFGRRAPGEAQGRAWSVSALLQTHDGEVRLGTGLIEQREQIAQDPIRDGLRRRGRGRLLKVVRDFPLFGEAPGVVAVEPVTAHEPLVLAVW